MGQAGEKNLIEAKDVGVCVFKKKRGGGRGGKKTLPFLVMLGSGRCGIAYLIDSLITWLTGREFSPADVTLKKSGKSWPI